MRTWHFLASRCGRRLWRIQQKNWQAYWYCIPSSFPFAWFIGSMAWDIRYSTLLVGSVSNQVKGMFWCIHQEPCDSIVNIVSSAMVSGSHQDCRAFTRGFTHQSQRFQEQETIIQVLGCYALCKLVPSLSQLWSCSRQTITQILCRSHQVDVWNIDMQLSLRCGNMNTTAASNYEQ